MFQPAFNSSGDLVIANSTTTKDDTYRCLCCDTELILRKGKIIRPHFAHRSNSNCSSESAIHKAGKLLVREYLETGSPITVVKKCRRGCCKTEVILQLNGYNSVLEEEAFRYKGRRIIPDLAIVEDGTGDLGVIIEIFNTHRQKGRPEPWYEFKASEVVERVPTIQDFETHEGGVVLNDCRQYRVCGKPKTLKRKKRRQYVCGDCGFPCVRKRFTNCRHFSCRNCYNLKPEGYKCKYCDKPIK
jgi:hypothetical protein